ncbi:PPP4R2-domain-containing protein [Lactarius akahatsu]|uniref:PPP4R2-domain-containing protein n=1 Tax=Lactarius akahatsu TaxID=416441 RepID=A0AAD4LT04_9AGAM|nr:PPP4R2-domain-containing protein [Lactarius akahatsu]
MSSASDFQWSQGYDTTLERISSTDVLDVDWPKLRDIIKYKIDQNIAAFLADSHKTSSIYVPPFSPRPSTNGGMKLPPFTSRERDESNPNEAPKAEYTAEEAVAAKETIYSQLDGFDSAPFTIQRLADLCARPRENYTALGKYCRALEKSLFVTSTWNSFPPLPSQPKDTMGIAATRAGLLSTSVPTTPLFSPISFLHDDARRSRSRSPPPSPLNLNGTEHSGGAPLDTDPLSIEPRELGLVDELDDPNPGHLSDRPTALTSVTSIGGSSGAISLEDRFIRASDHVEDERDTKRQREDDNLSDPMLDERDGDKENKS